MRNDAKSWPDEIARIVRRQIPDIDESRISSAITEIDIAVRHYLRARPTIRKEKRVSIGVSETRAELFRVDQAISRALDAIAKMHFPARKAFCQTNGPVGALKAALKNATNAARNALEELSATPNKQSDIGRQILAARIANVVEHELGQAALLNRSTSNVSRRSYKTSEVKNNTYALLLLAALGWANAGTDIDEMALMREGKKKLKALRQEGIL